VFRQESPGERSTLLRHDNVVLTPHIGGATSETLLQGALMIAQEIERFAADEPLVHVVGMYGRT
jgi:phosphoglycerate dehydrogenase-like enzyme